MSKKTATAALAGAAMKEPNNEANPATKTTEEPNNEANLTKEPTTSIHNPYLTNSLNGKPNQTTAQPFNPTRKQEPTLAAFLKTAMTDTPKQGTAKAGRPKGTTTKAANGVKSTQFKVPEQNRRGPNTKKSRSRPKLMVDHKV